MFKILIIVILIIVFISGYSASYKSLNIDNLAFAIAIGIDKSETKNLSITFQFVKAFPSTEGASDTQPVFNTVECSSLTNGINIMNAYLGKKVNLSHCKLIVFSEELAKEGISDEVYSLINDVQIRPSANIIVSKCNTRYYIENSVPSLEGLIPKYYEIFPTTSEYTGYTANATIGNFFNALVCNYCSPYAILGGIASSEDNSSDNITTSDSTIKSNQASITGDRTSQNIGVAVFKEDKLVGELNAIETVCFLNIRKMVDSFLVSVPDPEDRDSNIDIYLTPNSTHSVDVDIVNGSAFVRVDFRFTGKIYSMRKDEKFLAPEVLKSVGEACNSYLQEQFSGYLYKTSTVFESDINGIGAFALSQFATTGEFDSFSWLSNYKNCTFDVKIDTLVDSGFLLTET